MNKRINFISIVFFTSLQLIGGEALAQNRIDSIQAEVKMLKESYNEKMTALYHEMLEMTQNNELPVWEQNRAKTLFHIFSNEESINYIIENIHVQWFQVENGESKKKQPYLRSLAKIIYQNGQKHPAIMEKLLLALDQPIEDYERIYIYSELILAYFYRNISQSLDAADVAACVRIIANPNSRFDTIRRQNLLKIAEILEKR